MSVPIPTRTQTVEALRRIGVIAEKLDPSVRWAESLSERAKTAGAGVRVGFSDPTSQAATDGLAVYVRQLDVKARRLVLRALACLEGAQGAYARAEQRMVEADRSAPEETTVVELHRSGHWASAVDLRDAKRAQSRRTARGEGWGTG